MARRAHDHLAVVVYEAGARSAWVERCRDGWTTWLREYGDDGRCVRQVRTEWGEQSTKARQVAREWVEGRRQHSLARVRA